MQLIKTPQPFKRLRVNSFYSGNKGFYCSMYPTSESLQRLVKHFRAVPQLSADQMVAPPLMHVTLMYSDSSIPVAELPWITRDVVFEGFAKGYDFFVKAHEVEGAVVMLLESPELDAYHEELSKMADYTWDEYKPHLTIAYGVNPTDAAILISTLASMPLPTGLKFTAPVYEDKS